MNPALSVIFFTTLSGFGYGIWMWLGVRLAVSGWWGAGEFEGLGWLLLTLLGGVLAGLGLLASFFHLGKPMRAWRAFSQWRTSWLSREGVLAVFTFLPAAALWLLPLGDAPVALALVGALLAISAALTVICTAMIYASLKPIPAWRHALVVPGYLGFAVLGGGLVWLAMMPADTSRIVMLGLAALALGMAVLKLAYWRSIDTSALPHTRGAAVGLPQRKVDVFERPHTEANYITREMGFVIARQHANTLRIAALVLFALLPLLGLLLLVTGSVQPGAWVWLLPLSALAGTFCERWLFFAQARHMVSLYY